LSTQILLFFLFILSNVHAASHFNFDCVQNDSLKTNFYHRLASNPASFKQALDSLEQIHDKLYNQHHVKEVREAYKEVLELQQDFLDYESMLFDTLFYPMVNRVLDELKAANSETQLYNHVLISKSRIPNAYCFGNGIIVINLGMISLLQNEDQLAALLAHEFAHHQLKHMEEGILHKKEYDSNKETKKKLRKISRSEYEQMARLEQFQLESAMNQRTMQRSLETQADSMAAFLLSNSNYELSSIIELLEILDRCDGGKYQIKLNYSELFSQADYVFEKNLLLNSQGMELKEIEDTALINALKTHPDCKQRIDFVQSDFAIKSRDTVQIEQNFIQLGLISDYELLFQDIENRRYALCILHSLQLKNAVRNEPFLDVFIANCLAEIYFAQKDHMLWNYLPLPREEFPINYHQLLVIIENIRLSELKKLSLAYISQVIQSTKEQLNDDQGYLTYLELQQKCIKENRLPQKEELDQFKEQYPLNSFINY